MISVSDKTGLIELAQALVDNGFEIVSTGSTASEISNANLPVTLVSDVTKFPEILDGRVKTLHPAIHAGVLADLSKSEHVETLKDAEIASFDLVVVNLYPFSETVSAGATFEDCIEQIDIGGPTLIRAAAKNFKNVVVLVSPKQYPEFVASIGTTFNFQVRQRFAAEAFAHTATYDSIVARWFARQESNDAPNWVGATYNKKQTLRYGENPHQKAALYVGETSEPGVAKAKVIGGKEMSYNNFVDADCARRAAFDHPEPCIAIIKHANPCGIAISDDLATAFGKALKTDEVSAFGGVVASNRFIDAAVAKLMSEIFFEVIVAPGFDEAALEILSTRENLRLLQVAGPHPGHRVEWRTISGGVLMQTVDNVSVYHDEPENWELVAGKPVSAAELADLEFAFRAVRAPKSNAILLAKDTAAVGIGMGQVNRVDAARLATWRAGDRAKGSVCASDAFFPFPDALEVLVKAGITAVVHPGGSKNDQAVIDLAKQAGISMYLTGMRHFSH
ncbi:MAG: bifunctional phosphoribosylaminoimidazolecarboxamide formyltransferase/IMP cyclohydrolase [Candidatus Nanopelagicales bacterium]